MGVHDLLGAIAQLQCVDGPFVDERLDFAHHLGVARRHPPPAHCSSTQRKKEKDRFKQKVYPTLEDVFKTRYILKHFIVPA